MSPVVIKITSNYVKRVLKKEKIDPIISYNEEIQKEMAQAIADEA